MDEYDKKLVLKFDPNTIEHLGISLYSRLPSVISELISNSWDADADNVFIHFTDTKNYKEIAYSDDGEGMSFDELNDKYLLIGRNRRKDAKQVTEKGRKVIGKKGLGKLSVFGICNEIDVLTIKGGIKNEFRMNLDEIKKVESGSYSPKLIAFNEPTDEGNGTVIKLKDVRRKTGFKVKDLALSLSKKFLIFGALNTKVKHNQDEDIIITDDLKFQGFNTQFTWALPDEKYDSEYLRWKQVRGHIYTLETPVKDTEMKGIYLTSRGKIVNTASFYGLRDTDQFHSYATGYLEVDFIDDFENDVISTDRSSLNWEYDETRELQSYLQVVIKKIGAEWKTKRSELKADRIKADKQIDIEEWKNKLPSHEKSLGNKIINPILENSNIDVSEAGKIISSVIDKFDNQLFKEYASKIADNKNPEDIPAFLDLMDEWKFIETKQFGDLAISRVEVINQFENYLKEDTKEVPTLHNFLKKFSWLLDPRILEFRDEVAYSKLLEETFPDDVLEESNRRIDFLCSNALGGVLYVIEIKRSKYKVDEKAIDQAYQYGSFLTEKYASQSGFSKVVCYVVGGEKSSSHLFRKKEETYQTTGEVFVKTYMELLEQSKEFHREFIDAYKAMSM